jgi:hypothetical protein
LLQIIQGSAVNPRNIIGAWPGRGAPCLYHQSAEWIIETWDSDAVPDFGTLAWTNCWLVSNGIARTLTDPALRREIFRSSVSFQISQLGPDGTSFTAGFVSP